MLRAKPNPVNAIFERMLLEKDWYNGGTTAQYNKIWDAAVREEATQQPRQRRSRKRTNMGAGQWMNLG